MNFDTFSVVAMAAELRSVLLNGRVQRVVQLNSLTFGFEIYVHPVRWYLLLSIEPQAPRLHLSSDKVRRGRGNDTPLMLMLRKYMRGARLRAIEQPPYERLLYFHFEGPAGPTELAAEMMGTRSNLLLLEPDHTILGAARLSKPATRETSQQRIILPGHYYHPPSPQERLSPLALTEEVLHQELEEASPEFELVRLLPQITRGVSPLVAREIVYRATGSVETTVSQLAAATPLLEAFRQLFDHLWQDHWQPTLAFNEDDEPAAFAPYPLYHLPRTQTTETFSEAVEKYFADAAAGYAAAKAPLAQAIEEARQKLARRRERLAEDAAIQANPAALKEKGEAILAYAYQIRPGQQELSVDWTFGEPPLKVSLDPALSASDNAQQYFNRYRKALRAAEEIPAQFEKIELEENYLDQLEQDLDMAEDRLEIDAVAGALDEAGYRRFKRKGQKRLAARSLRRTAPDGATIWVGKNARQNAYLTFSQAAPDDLWLHARGVPGAHVLIPTAQGLPSEEDVFWAAGVAAYYSRARHDTSVEVDVTVKKHVRAIKGAAPGLVTYRNESTLRVAPHAPDFEIE
jgi:predicted ribosome quality control (RQC) complex YloA/Tae2 family protein